MVGFFVTSRFFLFWINAALYVLLQTYWGQVLVYSMPSIEVANLIGIFILASVVFFARCNPPGNAIPEGYKWLYHLNPPTYTLSILTSIVYGDCIDAIDFSRLSCQSITNLPPTLSPDLTITQYVQEVFLTKHSEMVRDFGIAIAFIVLLRVLALPALRFLNVQKR